MTILDKFNFSYSTYDTYCKSQLWFYFMKIANSSESNPGVQVYGDAGNVVHNAGQDYWDNREYSFDYHWKQYNIDNQFGFNKTRLSKDKFYLMYNDLIKYMDEIKHTSIHKSELKIEKEFYRMNFKGFIDLYIETDEDIIIYDWKTNSNHDYSMHEKQRLLYSWLIYKIKGKIPLCKWVYLKNMQIIEERFTLERLKEFEMEILSFKHNILEKGNNISKYESGDWKNPFNKYYDYCAKEVENRHKSNDMEIHMSIKGNFVFFEGDMNPVLKKGIDYKTKFDLPNKFFMQKEMRKNGRGRINIDDIGTIHLFNSKFNCFPIGLLDPITKICNEFAEHYNKEMKIFLYDKRDKSVMNAKLGIMPSKLITDKVFRPYQIEAVDIFMEEESGIFAIATGGGKTIIATEIIRRVDGITLWIIDRKELLLQTKKVLEDLLGIEIGVIGGGIVNIKNVTIATVQSLNSKLSELEKYLYTVNFVCVDEYHKSAANSYQTIFAKLPNTKYRLGLTATPNRDDGREPILYSILRKVIYKKTTQELIDEGYLVKPDIIFYKIIPDDISKLSYSEDYNINIINNIKRNSLIEKICLMYKENKIMVLTKQVAHGKYLKDLIPESEHIHGISKDRKEIMERFRDGQTKILVITNSIGAEGLDIPDMDIIINAAANKGDVKSVQTLGRVLRIFKNKNSARYIDFLDGGIHTKKHSLARIKSFKKQGHEVKIL